MLSRGLRRTKIVNQRHQRQDQQTGKQLHDRFPVSDGKRHRNIGKAKAKYGDEAPRSSHMRRTKSDILGSCAVGHKTLNALFYFPISSLDGDSGIFLSAL